MTNTETTNTGMRKGFTMIELIFVIVIIGILAAVAIPKLAANKDDATAKTCQHEIGQIISEISGAYTASTDFTAWSTTPIQDVTNVLTNATSISSSKGIAEAGTTVVDGNPLTYLCDSEVVATFNAAKNATTNKYEITVTTPADNSLTSPAAEIVRDSLDKQYGGVSKVFGL